MAINSTSGIAGTSAGLFPSIQVGAAKSALANLVNARIDLSKRPVAANDLASLNGLSVQRAQLSSQTVALTNDKAKFDGVTNTLDGISTQLNALVDLAGDAASAVPAGLPAIQAAAEDIVSQIRSTLSGFNTRFPELTITSTVPTQANPGLSIIEQTFIESVNRPIPQGGITVTVDIVAPGGSPAFPNALGTGGRGEAFAAIQTAAAAGTQLAGAVDFNIAGNRGLVNFNFAAGTTQSDVIDGINARTADTGVTAQQTDGFANHISLFTEGYGPDHFVSISEFTDPAGAVNPRTATGLNAIADITVDGATVRVEAEGRVFRFDAGGVQGILRLYDNDEGAAGLDENIGRAPITFDVLGGGTSLTSLEPTEAIVGFTGLNSESLGLVSGGLDRIDFVNDIFTATKIVQEASLDINSSIAKADSFASTAASRLGANIDQIAAIDESIASTEDILSGLDLFSSLDAEARFQSAQSVFAQVSSLFPVSASRLL